jgi:hypothetical protein
MARMFTNPSRVTEAPSFHQEQSPTPKSAKVELRERSA